MMSKTKQVEKRLEMPKETRQQEEATQILSMPDAGQDGPLHVPVAEEGQFPPDAPADGEELTPTLTPQETADLQRLEEVFSQGQRESIAALREIRERKLYRADYKTFDDYIQERWGHSRQWATQQTNWLRRTELLEATGNERYQLTVDDAKVLGDLEDYPEEFVRAVVRAEEQARQLKKARTKKMLEEAVEQQLDFIARREDTQDDLTWAEHLLLESLGDSRRSHPNLVEQAIQRSKQEGKPLPECLAAMCAEQHALPIDDHLLSVARGDALAELVRPLAALRARWDQENEFREKEEKLQAELEKVRREREAKQQPAQPQATQPQPETLDGSAKPAGQDSRQEPEEIYSPFEVEATGDFAHLLQFENKAGLTLADVVELLLTLAGAIQEDGLTEGSLVVRSDEETEEEEEEDSFDLDDDEERADDPDATGSR